VDYVIMDVSEEYIASIIRLKSVSELGTSLTVSFTVTDVKTSKSNNFCNLLYDFIIADLSTFDRISLIIKQLNGQPVSC
jgi:hypothetical protein